MKVCKDHWQVMRQVIDDRGMGGLVAQSGEAAAENIVKELEGDKPHFDPLMSMNHFWWGQAMKNGGLYLLSQNEDGSNDGHYCPICEFAKHYKDFDAGKEIGLIADQMRDYAIDQGLIPKLA